MTKLALVLLFILAGCNVANQPATLSEGSGVGGDSGPRIGFAAGSSSRSEFNALVSLPYSFTEAPTSPTNITFSYSGTATGGPACLPGVDYIYPPTPTAFPAGVLSGVLDISLCNDGTYEGNESIIVTIASTVPAVGLNTNGTHIVTLTDSLSQPTISFTTASSGSIAEGAAGFTNVPVTIQLSHPSTQVVSFQVSIAGSATLGSDYTLSATSFNVMPGDTTANLTVTIFGDNIIEPNENIVLGLFAPSNASFGLQSTHELQIAQDEVPATIVANVAPPATVLESVGTSQFTINLTGVSDQPTTLNFAIDFASAIAASRRATYPDDFSLVNVSGDCSFGSHSVVTSGMTGTITICPGQASVTVPVSITNDSLYEPTEGIVLRLTGGPLVSVGGFPAGELIIDESDVANKPIISFQSPGQSLVESNTAGGITIRMQDPLNSALDRASGEDVTVTLTPVDVTTEGALDWALGATTVVIPAGQTRVTIPISVLQDGTDEDNESLNVNLSTLMTYSLGISTHAVTIIDNDAASRVTFQLVSQTVTEDPTDPNPLVVNLVLDRPSERILTVNYTVGGSVTSTTGACGGAADISAPGTLVIPAGTTLIPLGIQKCFDQSYEGSETAQFTITSVTNGALGASLVHTATITDDEALPIISLSASNNGPSENSGNIVLTASIDNAPITAQSAMVIPISFAGTAVRGTHFDYTGSAITIPAGATSGTLTVTLINNNLYGGEKNFTATLGTGFWQLGTSSQVVTITDDEVVPQIGFTTAALTVAESVGAQAITLRVNPGFPACEGPMSIGLSRAGTSVFGEDHDFLHPSAGIAAGATSTNLNYNIINDNMHEPGVDETLEVTVTSAICNGVNLLLFQPASPGTITVSITDDDPQPVIGYDVSSRTFMENAAGPNTITIRLDRPSSQAISINSTLTAYTPAPADMSNPTDPEFFRATTNAIPSQDLSVAVTAFVIPAGQTSVTQTITIVNDADYEYTETADFTLSGEVNATLSATANTMTVNIANDDALPYTHLSFVNNPAELTTARSLIESDTTAQDVFALLSNSATNGGAGITAVVPVLVNLSIQGTASNTIDYTLGDVTSSAVTVPAGESSITFSTTHIDDALLENVETIRFATASITNGQISSSNSQITHSISLDDDLPPVVTVTPSPAIVAEGESATFTVTVQPVGKAITLDYTIAGTAIAGLDHSLESGTLDILPSTAEQNIPLVFTIVNDNTPEADETIDISLVGNPPADADTGDANATITIEVSDYLQLANGDTHTCGLLGGQVKCWGEVQYLGYAATAIEIVANGLYGVDASETVASLPYVQLGTGFVPTKIVANTNSTCAMSSTGSVKCWGSNADGRLGQSVAPIAPNNILGDAAGEMGDNLPPINLGNPAVDITVGNRHACALLDTGRIKCWGYNGFGQLGVAVSGADCSNVNDTHCIGDGPEEMAALPVVSFPEAGTVVQVVAGYNTTCALLTTGRIYCFGENTDGQLGQDKADAMYGDTAGDMTDSVNFRPVQLNAVFSSLPVVGMAAGDNANCAVFLNGVNMETLCWGSGTGTEQTPLSAVTTEVDYFGLGSFNTLRSVTANAQNVCVRGDTNQVLCWGADTSGKLGNGGDNTDTADFIGQDLTGALANDGTFLNLSTGANGSCAAVAVNQFSCWGLNSSGQIGNESAAAAVSPTAAIDFD